MGADALAVGVTAFAALYAVLLPTPWLVPVAPVAFATIAEIFERARQPSMWLLPLGSSEWVKQPPAGRRGARGLYLGWGVGALLLHLLLPPWAPLLYVPWLATVPWLLLYYGVQARMRRSQRA